MRKSEETRNHIIEIAAPIFNKSGYAGTSLSDILEQTTLTKGAIYHYFENKDELALAALEYNLKLASDYNFREVKDEALACDRLILFAEAFKNNYDIMKQMGGCPIMNAAVDSDDGNQQIRDRVLRFIKMWRKSIRDIIEQGKRKSQIKPEVDTDTFSMNFISLIEGALAMSRVSDDRKFIDNAVALVVSLVGRIRL